MVVLVNLNIYNSKFGEFQTAIFNIQLENQNDFVVYSH